MKRIFITLLLLLLMVSSVRADKNLVVRSVTAADFTVIKIIGGSTFKLCVTYQLKDSLSNKVGTEKVFCKELTEDQKTTLISFIRDGIKLVTDVNIAEGL